jgi:hypothetical protein
LINETVIVIPESLQSDALHISQNKIKHLTCITYYAPVVQN